MRLYSYIVPKQDFANTAWAFAKADHLDIILFVALARAAERHVLDFKPQELANTAWAFATMCQSDSRHLLLIGIPNKRNIKDYNGFLVFDLF